MAAIKEAGERFVIVESQAAIYKPIRGVVSPGGGEPLEVLDTVDTFGYAKALAKHGKVCGTPLTAGVQGEWESGETSLFVSPVSLGPPESQIDEVQEDSYSENGPGQPVSSPETVSV